jgi:hypothetical protein
MRYSVGLLTSISSALIGLQEAGAYVGLTADQQKIALALLEEAQRKTTSNGSAYKNNCAGWTSNLQPNNTNPCSDGGEAPKAYRMTGTNSLFSRYVSVGTPQVTVVDLGVSQSAYQFNYFSPSLFTLTGNGTSLNWARKMYYGNLGNYWHTISPGRDDFGPQPEAGEIRPRLWAHLDDYQPIGYFDGITGGGIAYGWSCDNDIPDASVKIDFYVNSIEPGNYVATTVANQGSSQTINGLCGGGYYHRFGAQLPAWTKGYPILAAGLDATWRGFTVLGCWQQPGTYPACVW